MPPRKQTDEKPTASVDPALTDNEPAHMTDDELAAATQQAAEDAGTEVCLAVGYPHDEFRPFGDEDLVLSKDGTTVPADRESDIRSAARAAGVTIRKVK